MGGRWRRCAHGLVIAAVVYLAVSLGFQVIVFGVVGGARLTGQDPRHDDAPVANLRDAGPNVLAGAQPSREGYRALAGMGVATVVDLRTGATDDPRHEDPAYLRSLGIDYVSLPVPDGHAPDRATMRQFSEIVAASDGIVYLHCGAGVGRSSALEAAHRAAVGHGRGFWDVVATGPMTLEQLWVVARARGDDPRPSNALVRRVSEFLDAPRRGWSRLRAVF